MMTSEQKIKRALTQLDNAVQAWYAEHNPENKERYADATIFEYDEGYHVARVTLNTDPEGKVFVDIRGTKHGNHSI